MTNRKPIKTFPKKFERLLRDCNCIVDFEKLLSEIAFSIKSCGIFHPEVPIEVKYFSSDRMKDAKFVEDVDELKKYLPAIFEQDKYHKNHGNHYLVTDAITAILKFYLNQKGGYGNILEFNAKRNLEIRNQLNKMLQVMGVTMKLSPEILFNRKEVKSVNTMFTQSIVKALMLSANDKHDCSVDLISVHNAFVSPASKNEIQQRKTSQFQQSDLLPNLKLIFPDIPTPTTRYFNKPQVRCFLKQASEQIQLPNAGAALSLHTSLNLGGIDAFCVSDASSSINNLSFVLLLILN